MDSGDRDTRRFFTTRYWQWRCKGRWVCVSLVYSWCGHSLNALDDDGDSVADVMVLAGGNSPIPSNESVIAVLTSPADAIINY